jgi:ATP-dependent Clp protease adaptor protein ClpS
MGNPASPKVDDATLTQPRSAVGRPPMYKVVLHNDDFTSMEFVVSILVTYFHKEEVEATRIMLQVHLQGAGVAGVFVRDQAETKVAQVTAAAEREGFPLLATMEPE